MFPLDQKTTSVKKTRAPKVIEYIDFVEADPVDMKALFAKGSGSISMAKADKSDHLLPDDIHFSSKDLLKLFTNPEIKVFAITFRGLV